MADSRASISAFDALRVAAPAGASAARVARHRMPVGVAATAVAIIAVATSTQVLFQSIAIGAGAAGALADFLGALVDALMIGASIALAMTIALRAAPARGLAAGVAIAIVAGACAGSWMVEARYWSPADVTLAGVLPNAVRYALIAGVAVITSVMVSVAPPASHRRRSLRVESETNDAERFGRGSGRTPGRREGSNQKNIKTHERPAASLPASVRGTGIEWGERSGSALLDRDVAEPAPQNRARGPTHVPEPG